MTELMQFSAQPPESGTQGPMRGIKIVELSTALAGPWATAILADQGAEVIKVERPGIGDIARYIGVSVNGMSALFQMCNRGKRSIAIDVHTPEGRDTVRELARDADVFMQNYRPGVVERLGLGYDDLSAINPDLIYASVSGFGPVGPYAKKGAYDTVIQAYAGFGHNQRDLATGVPRFLQQTAADKTTALTASQAITAALFARERGAGGQHINIAMLDAVAAFLWADSAGNEVLLDADGSLPSSFVQGLSPLVFTDGYAVATPTSDADYFGMCRAFDVEGLDDPRIATISLRYQNADVSLPKLLTCYERAATMTVAEGMQRLERENVPCGVVLSPAELVHDTHAIATGLFEESVHPMAGRLRQNRPAAQFSRTASRTGAPAPGLGEHTEVILAELRDRIEFEGLDRR